MYLSHEVVFKVMLSIGALEVERIVTLLFTDCQKPTLTVFRLECCI